MLGLKKKCNRASAMQIPFSLDLLNLSAVLRSVYFRRYEDDFKKIRYVVGRKENKFAAGKIWSNKHGKYLNYKVLRNQFLNLKKKLKITFAGVVLEGIRFTRKH